MSVPRLIKRKLFRRRTLHSALTICLLASLLAGLIPSPLVSSTITALAAAALPPALAGQTGG